jgi:anthranilate phosphoribosyltransferase
MNTELSTAIDDLRAGRNLSAPQTADAFGIVMRGEAADAEIEALLLGLKAKGEVADEIAGAAFALREAMISVNAAAGAPLVDTCGTGGGTVSTFNISTAAALVITGAGARVAKHGNRSYTSKCGSADVLEALNITITHAADEAALQLNQRGMVFLFAPNYHPAMRHVGPIRKRLGVATIMNLLGPLANPASVRRQVIGVADPARGPLMAAALVRLGAEHVLVVHGEAGMDEISPIGRTLVWEVRDGAVTTWSIDPAEFGLASGGLEELRGGEPAENARRIEELVEGREVGLGRTAVLLNAGAGLYVAGLAKTVREGVRLAEETLRDGRAARVLKRLRSISGSTL